MSGITRFTLRFGLLSALALGGITLMLKPERVWATISQVQAKAQDVVDTYIDDPIALRHQLAQLADEYPIRISEVSGELNEVQHQLEQFERDVEVAERVVALTTTDLEELKTLVARAEAETQSSPRPVAIRFGGVRFDLKEAYTEGRRINNVRSNYQDRLEHDKVQLSFLAQQQERLADILANLEDEYSTYQTQLWQLDRQIDSIERNERLIELTEQQQATLSSYDRFGKVDNLKQIEGKLAELRAQQEAQLQVLGRWMNGKDYEDIATFEIDAQDGTSDDPFTLPSDVETDEPTENDKTFAFLGPKVIE